MKTIAFQPLARYVAWWKLTESCSGATADFASVRWFTIPQAGSFQLEGQSVNGAWYPDGKRIVLAQGSVTDGELVRSRRAHLH